MTGRFPTYAVLKTVGTAAQKYVWYGILLDQDYQIISIGLAPDSGSVGGQLAGFVGNVRGGSTFGSGSLATKGPVATDFSGSYILGTNFGALVDLYIGDRSTSPGSLDGSGNYFVPLWATINPKFYNRMPIARSGTMIVAVIVDANADAITRTATLEIQAIPWPGEQAAGA